MMRDSTQRYAVGLHRGSTAEQGNSGLGLKAQQTSVRAFVAAQGWSLVAEYSMRPSPGQKAGEVARVHTSDSPEQSQADLLIGDFRAGRVGYSLRLSFFADGGSPHGAEMVFPLSVGWLQCRR